MNITVDLDSLLNSLPFTGNYVYLSRTFAESIKQQAGDLVVVKDIAENPLSTGMYLYTSESWNKEQQLLARFKQENFEREILIRDRENLKSLNPNLIQFRKPKTKKQKARNFLADLTEMP